MVQQTWGCEKSSSRKKPGFVVTGTQCIDRWWQSLEKALPQSLHVKEKPGGGLDPKLIWGFVWRSNLPNNANLTKELAAIMDWRPFTDQRKETTSAVEAGTCGQIQKILQIPMQKDVRVPKTQAKSQWTIIENLKIMDGLTKITHEKQTKSTITAG